MERLFAYIIANLLICSFSFGFGEKRRDIIIIDPPWVYLDEQADLLQTDAGGSILPVVQKFQLQTMRIAGKTSDSLISMVFSESKGEGTLRTGYDVTGVSTDACGSTVYFGFSQFPGEASATIRLLDHASRLCDDFKKYRWEVTLNEGRNPARYFVGTPGKVIEELDCSPYENPICITLYDPKTCSIGFEAGDGNVGGTFYGSGGNACFAMAAASFKACQAGFDPEKATKGNCGMNEAK